MKTADIATNPTMRARQQESSQRLFDALFPGAKEALPPGELRLVEILRWKHPDEENDK
jgi:hypothetical protein